MEPLIDLAPGAEDNPLAVHLIGLVRGNLAGDPARVTEFRTIRGSVLVVAQDTGDTLTMRFDHGRLTVHDGAIGVPLVTFCGDDRVLRQLPELTFHRWLKLPTLGVLHPSAGAPTREIAVLVARGDLKIYGLLAHPRLILALLRVLSVHH